MVFDLEDLIWNRANGNQSTRSITSLAKLLKEGFQVKDSLVLRYTEDSIQEVYYLTKEGVCYSLTMDEYKQYLDEPL